MGNKIGQRNAQVIKNVKDIGQFKPGEILVTDMTDPDWVPIMRIASAIVTNRGGRTSHAAIVSRELGLPCIVGTNNATRSALKMDSPSQSTARKESMASFMRASQVQSQTIDVQKVPNPQNKDHDQCRLS